MFEKEAEKYGNSFEWTNDDRIIDYSKQGFKKGAEFGYNFAKEEIDYLNKHWRSEEESKANEWHYPSKGEYPKEDKRYLCKIKAFVGGGINYECFDYDTEYGSWKNACGDVIAWKEIVLPELPKESE